MLPRWRGIVLPGVVVLASLGSGESRAVHAQGVPTLDAETTVGPRRLGGTNRPGSGPAAEGPTKWRSASTLIPF